MATILYAEDDDGLRAAVCGVMSDWGHTVYDSPTPQDALESMGEGIDLVVTDYDFSYRSSTTGVGLASILQRTYPNVPVVIFSGLDRTRECMEAGVEAHQASKGDFGELRDLIAALTT